MVNKKIQKYKTNPAWHPNIPVIVVGNIFVGGTGKTPVVIELVKFLQTQGFNPAVISRGYGVKPKTDAVVGKHPLDPSIFGDEPALIAKETGATIAVHPKRVQAALALINENNKNNANIDVIVLDDGLQHLSIARDIEIIVQDARGIGNGRLLPAGPLREPATKLNNVDIIINNNVKNSINTYTETHSSNATEQNNLQFSSIKPPINCYMELHAVTANKLDSEQKMPWSKWLDEHKNKKISALAGIGNPNRFFNMLKKDLVNIQNLYPLVDHAHINQKIFDDIAGDIILITTKDAIKCKNIQDPRVWVVNAEPKFNSDLWLQYVLDKLNNWKSNANKIN